MAEFNGVGNAAPFFITPFHYYFFHILWSFMMIEPTNRIPEKRVNRSSYYPLFSTKNPNNLLVGEGEGYVAYVVYNSSHHRRCRFF